MMITFLLFSVLSHVSLATGVVYQFHFVMHGGKQDCNGPVAWQMPFPWPAGSCFYDWTLFQYVSFQCGSNANIGKFEETCFSDAQCSTPIACLGDGSLDPVVYTNGVCMMDFVNSAAHGHKTGIHPYTMSWPTETCAPPAVTASTAVTTKKAVTVNEQAVAGYDQYESKEESQVGQAGVVYNLHVTVYSGKTDCNGPVQLDMPYPYPPGICMWDYSLDQYITLNCGSNDKLLETCFSDDQCSHQIACLGDGSLNPVVYTNGVCMMDFVNSAAHGNKPGIVPFMISWPAGMCSTTVSEQALADSHQWYEYLSANTQAYESKDVVYYGLAMIGLFSIIRGFYGAFQPSYKTIPSEEASDV